MLTFGFNKEILIVYIILSKILIINVIYNFIFQVQLKLVDHSILPCQYVLLMLFNLDFTC